MRLGFLKPVVLLTLVLVALLAYPIYAWLWDSFDAILAAWIIVLVNTVIGLLIIELTLNKDNFIFMAAFFGGMGIRVFLTLMALALLLSSGYDGMVLTFFLMGLYFTYLVVEIRYLISVLSRYKGQKAT